MTTYASWSTTQSLPQCSMLKFRFRLRSSQIPQVVLSQLEVGFSQQHLDFCLEFICFGDEAFIVGHIAHVNQTFYSGL
jgi:hypothetical protein